MGLEEGSERAHPLEGVRVLVLDEDVDGREALQMALEQRGADVVAVGTPNDAIRAFDEAPPDVFVSDLMVAGEDACDLLRRVRKREIRDGGGVSAAALTTRDAPADQRRAHEAGFQVHVSKPVEPEYLVAVVALLAGRFAELEHLLDEIRTRSATYAALMRRLHALQAERERLLAENRDMRARSRFPRNRRA
jgi:CheY-like chemotaxis protein